MKNTFKRAALGGVALASLTYASLALAAPGEVSFTPTGLKLSVMRITLSSHNDSGGADREQVLYTCPHATEAECLVDVTSQSELDAIASLAAAAKVDVGSYDMVSLELCAPGNSGSTPAPGYVRGSFTVTSEGKTYATAPDAANGIREVLEGDDAGADFTAIGNWSCSSKRVLLRTPVVVEKDTPTALTVVVDPNLIAFSTPNVSGGMGGCRGESNGSARGVCVSYPSMVPLVGEATPQLDRFLLAHHRTDANAIDDAKANGYVVVVREADGGEPLTAFLRPYYSETSARTTSNNVTPDEVYGGPAYFGETLVESVHLNPDGSLGFTTGGTLDGNSAIFQAFQLADHKATVDTHDAGTWQYHAMPLP